MAKRLATAEFLDRLSSLTAGVIFNRASIFHDSCSLGCVHCGWRGHPSRVRTARDDPFDSKGTSTWMRTLEWCRERGVETVTLTGGEVTEREDYSDIIRYALWLGLRVVIETHGRRFADKNFCRELSPGRPLHYIVSFHGSRPSVHETITRQQGSFADTLEGIRNLRRLTASKIDVMTVAQAANISDISEIYKVVAAAKPASYIVSLVMLRGLAARAKLPSVAVIRETIERLRMLREQPGNQTELVFNNFPLCLLGEDRQMSANYPAFNGPSTNYELMIHPDNLNRTFLARMALPSTLTFPRPCVSCFYRDVCPAPAYVTALDHAEELLVPFGDRRDSAPHTSPPPGDLLFV
jgi:MoaA/NifB/PqqE/SkfB family radical SAM enzyme